MFVCRGQPHFVLEIGPLTGWELTRVAGQQAQGSSYLQVYTTMWAWLLNVGSKLRCPCLERSLPFHMLICNDSLNFHRCNMIHKISHCKDKRYILSQHDAAGSSNFKFGSLEFKLDSQGNPGFLFKLLLSITLLHKCIIYIHERSHKYLS